MNKIKLLLILLVVGCSLSAQKKAPTKPAPKAKTAAQTVRVEKTTWSSSNQSNNSKSKMSNQKQPGIYATIETDKGNIVIQLEYKKTPMTVANFVGLAEGKLENTAKPLGTPYYDGLKFHRVITKGNGDPQDFMIQGGDPTGTGTSGPGYQFPDEIDPSLKHDNPGTLSMANAGPGTNGSQFFITVAPTNWLDGRHTVFGHVVSGMDVVHQIKVNDVMKKVTIERIGSDAQNFKVDKASFDALKASASARAEEMQKAERAKQEEMMREMQRKNMQAAQADMPNFIAEVKKTYPTATILSSGLAYVMEREGTGPKAKAGDNVSVHYHGAFTDGKKFDASYDRNQPIDFQLGRGMVIPGWEEGIALLNKGAKAKLIIPYWLAYGVEGRAPVIPAKATLIFDTEMMDIKP